MDVNQLIDGIGAATAAAKPVQEYCLLFINWWPMCMTKSEWSGWVQSFGVVFALGAPLIKWRIDLFRAKPTAQDAYREAMRWSKNAKRLELITGKGSALYGPASTLIKEALEIVRTTRNLTDEEVDAVRLFSPSAANRLKTCVAIRAHITGILEVPSNVLYQDFSAKMTLDLVEKHAQEYLSQISQAVSTMSKLGINAPRRFREIFKI